jgi:uncharacterized protein YecE (DUF72 family)
MAILVGTSGWNYPTGRGSWNGVFYPPRRPRGFDELAYYAEHFDTVEVNSTFYRVPEADLTRAWVRRTPDRFQFAVKLYQKFTHPDMYLKRPGASTWDVTCDDLDQFRAGLDPMAAAGRLAALLIQFPASFKREPDTAAYVDWLAAALADYPLAVELRHRSWSDAREAVHAALAEHRAAWVYIDEPKFASSIRQDLAADHAGGSDLVYVRLHGRNADAWWEHDESADRYDYLYRPDELMPIAAAAQDAARRRRVLIYLNNHFSAKSVANAAILKHQLGDLVPGMYSTEMLRRFPELEGIVRTDSLLPG